MRILNIIETAYRATLEEQLEERGVNISKCLPGVELIRRNDSHSCWTTTIKSGTGNHLCLLWLQLRRFVITGLHQTEQHLVFFQFRSGCEASTSDLLEYPVISVVPQSSVRVKEPI